MIDVRHLTKRYGTVTALDDVTLRVDSAGVFGLLGPNGAGKTTMMRILTSFLPATEGDCRVCGFDVFSDHLEVRRRIGYLPEHAPLYDDMRVTEYLFFRARLKGLRGRKMRRQVNASLESCGLEDVQRQVIGRLSKGYRQRVGLADALLAEPQLFILDEPTIGLDPHQLRHVRELIRSLGQDRTVLVSSHILSEIELLCSRVFILRQGRLVADDTTQKLLENRGAGWRVIVVVKAPPADVTGRLAAVEGVTSVCDEGCGEDGWQRLVCRCGADEEIGPRVHALIATEGWKLREFQVEKGRLEDVFVELTGASSLDPDVEAGADGMSQ